MARWTLADSLVLTPAQRAFVAAYAADFSEETWEVSLAGQAASQRYFVRLSDTKNPVRSFVLVVWDSRDDDWPRFLAIPGEVVPYVPFLPKIYCADARHGLILEEDLGERTLHYAVSKSKGGEEAVMDAYRRALDALCAWQSVPAKASPSIAERSMDRATFLWESDYFARCCVADFCGLEHLLDAAWEKERGELASAAAALPATVIHRDFQSENILLTGAGVRFVDFQGARLGPPAYDVASLLYDPYVAVLDGEITARLFDYYCSCGLVIRPSRHDFFLCAVQRLMQACGAYGNLSIHKGKSRYRVFLPVALERLGGVMEMLPEYPLLTRVVAFCREAIDNKAE
jgi:N-acetylmuramate 1-kinase